MNKLVVNKITPKIGAELIGVDLSKKIESKILDLIYHELIKNKVIFFRNQKITPRNHLNLAKSFGKIEPPHPVYPHVKKFPEIVLLENNKKKPPDTDVWHTDVTFRENPPFASILYSKIIPKLGGDTLWSSLTAIYDALPKDMKKYLEKLKAIHDMGDFRNNFTANQPIGTAKKLIKGFNKFGTSIHPIISMHPITNRKILYINPGFTNHIIGLNTSDSNNLLSYLFSFMNKPEFQIRFKWTPDTIAIWDNRCTMHYALADYIPHHRMMHRITIKNDKRVTKK
ncbi:TauD/TfdA family dioxygenase [Alphaproteobacteria bacterium]|nr:TauD/TfdA family dioxygenase [Alphaproteobacteria bacterium]